MLLWKNPSRANFRLVFHKGWFRIQMTKIAFRLSLRIRDRIIFPPSFSIVAQQTSKQDRQNIFPHCYIKMKTRVANLMRFDFNGDLWGIFSAAYKARLGPSNEMFSQRLVRYEIRAHKSHIEGCLQHDSMLTNKHTADMRGAGGKGTCKLYINNDKSERWLMMTASTAILPKRMPEIVKRFLFLDVFPTDRMVWS